MDKKSTMRSAKRQSKVLEENFWDCSVCTYRNMTEAFKCLMCDVRKGTSTSKPQLKQALGAQQAGAVGGATGSSTTPPATADKAKKVSKNGTSSVSGRSRPYPPRLRDVDRSTGQAREVTVNSITVVSTEYKRRQPPQHSDEDSSDTRP